MPLAYRMLYGTKNEAKGGKTMVVTIATHNGSAVSREHNIRNRRVTNPQEHIDQNGKYEIWHDEKIREAYDYLRNR